MKVIKVKHDHNTVDIVLLSFVITKFIGVNDYSWAYFWAFCLEPASLHALWWLLMGRRF